MDTLAPLPSLDFGALELLIHAQPVGHRNLIEPATSGPCVPCNGCIPFLPDDMCGIAACEPCVPCFPNDLTCSYAADDLVSRDDTVAGKGGREVEVQIFPGRDCTAPFSLPHHHIT
jgi:hypothetical protein